MGQISSMIQRAFIPDIETGSRAPLSDNISYISPNLEPVVALKPYEDCSHMCHETPFFATLLHYNWTYARSNQSMSLLESKDQTGR